MFSWCSLLGQCTSNYQCHYSPSYSIEIDDFVSPSCSLGGSCRWYCEDFFCAFIKVCVARAIGKLDVMKIFECTELMLDKQSFRTHLIMSEE